MQEAVCQILEGLDLDPTAARFATAANKLDRLTLDDWPQLRLAIVRNITLEPFAPYFKVECYRSGMRPHIFVGEFDNAEQEALHPDSALYAASPDVVVVAMQLRSLAPALCLSSTDLKPDALAAMADDVVRRIARLVGEIRRRCAALILVHNFEVEPGPAAGIRDASSAYGQQNTVRRLNLALSEALAEVSGAYVVDVDRILSQLGYEQAIDDRYWHIARAPYGPQALRRLAAEYGRFARALKGKNRKCLVLDCDNTLWGGVIGEDGMAGIKLGATHPGSAYLEFQAAVLDLYRSGVILAVCSKNNEADAMAVFTGHPESLLRPEHFVTFRINWNDKASNIRSIARELNIGLDSLVFMDDSAYECELVRRELPEVLTIHLPEDPTSYRRLLRSLGAFDTLVLSEEDRRRTAMYQAEQQRTALKEEATSLDEYLASLEMRLEVAPAAELTIPRIAQLTQKTNQFNLTTRRYSEADVARMTADALCRVYGVRLADRFDDLGVIGAAIVRLDDDIAIIDTLLLSCRALGRGVEDGLLQHIAADAASAGASRLRGEYIPTPKNAQVAEFFPKRGFKPVAGSDPAAWELSMPAAGLRWPRWFATPFAAPGGDDLSAQAVVETLETVRA